jgi:hypothetical protein
MLEVRLNIACTHTFQDGMHMFPNINNVKLLCRGVSEGVKPAPRKGKLVGEAKLTKKVPWVMVPPVPSPSVLPFSQIGALIAFLMENSDVFTWHPSDLFGVPREVIEHHLAICPQARPVKQKIRRQAQNRQDVIIEEVRKLEKAKVIQEVLHSTWEANPVVVPKPNGAYRP